MASKPWLLAGLFVLLAAIVSGGQSRDHEPTWRAPSHEAERVNPLVGREDVVAGGRKLFQQRCASCHGADGLGTSKAPNLADRQVQVQADGALYWKISHGNVRTGMPSFSFLPEPQRWQLVLHLRSLANPTERIADAWQLAMTHSS